MISKIAQEKFAKATRAKTKNGHLGKHYDLTREFYHISLVLNPLDPDDVDEFVWAVPTSRMPGTTQGRLMLKLWFTLVARHLDPMC